MTAAALRLDKVAYRFAGETMRFDLDVAAGEWLAVIGPSGAGKSTLLDLAAGFLAPDEGRIVLAGRDVTGDAPGERPLSLIFQENNLFAHLTAYRNVALGLSTKGRLAKSDETRVREALSSVGLAGLEARRPGEMSGGERQRVALARAFVRGRPLLLLDEPFAALGPALRKDMLRLIATLRQARPAHPLTIVMVTHQPEDARGFADRIAFVEDGRIEAVGPTSAMLGGTTSRGLRAYLGL